MFEKFKIIRVEGKNFKTIDDDVVIERTLKFYINDEFISNLSCSPGYEKELAIGLCVGEGTLEKDAMKEILIGKNDVRIYTNENDVNFKQKFIFYLSSDCMSKLRPTKIIKGKEDYDVVVQNIIVFSDLRITPEKIFEGMRKTMESGEIWKKTGGTHIAGLMFGENFNKFIAIEDISRRIAMYKIFGFGIINRVNFAKSAFFTSGRFPADIISNISRMDIPIAITRTAVTCSGIKVAENTNVTLVGFVRGNKFNIYTHSERIIKD